MKTSALLLTALTLASCTAPATIPTQTEQLRQGTELVDETQQLVDQVNNQQQQKLQEALDLLPPANG